MQNYQDATAICSWVGYPDLFLMFTCNPKWIEIEYLLEEMGKVDKESRVQAICRVFEIKLHKLMHDLKKKKYFG